MFFYEEGLSTKNYSIKFISVNSKDKPSDDIFFYIKNKSKNTGHTKKNRKTKDKQKYNNKKNSCYYCNKKKKNKKKKK